MMMLVWIFGAIAAYICVGTVAARIARGSFIDDATTDHGLDRMLVTCRVWIMIFGWPLFSWVWAVECVNHAAMDRADPEVAAKQAKRIAELERQLGMTK